MKSSYVLAYLLLGVIPGVTTAAPILWSLQPVTLQGCCAPPPLNEQTAIVSGTFLFDSQTQTYLDWNFSVSGYTGPVAPLNGMFTPGTSNIVIGGPTFLHLMSPSNQADLVLTFGFFTIGGIVEVPLTDRGGDVPVLISNSPRFLSFSAGASSVVSSVPEPAAGVLMVMGAAILCLSKPGLFRRRARKT